MYYGWKKKIAILGFTTSPSIERDFNKYLPDGIACLNTRVLVERIDAECLAAVEEKIIQAAKDMSSAEIDLCIYPCTSGSFIKGIGYDQEIIKRLEEATGGVKSFTTSTAMIHGLRTVNARKIALATPYCDEVNKIEKKFLEDSGFEVVDVKGLGLTDTNAIPKVNIDEIYHMVMSLDRSNADAVFISCNGLCFLDYVPMIENDLGGIPLVTSMQSTLWMALRELGMRDDLGLGQLFKL